MSLGAILLIIVILMLLGVLPYWGHSRNWGYGSNDYIGYSTYPGPRNSSAYFDPNASDANINQNNSGSRARVEVILPHPQR